MQTALQLRWHNVDPSDAVAAHVREEVDRLERFSDRITGCAVTLEAPSRHHRHSGGQYRVRVELSVPGGRLVVGRDPPKTWKDFVEGTVAGKWKASMPDVSYPSGGLTISEWYFAKLYGGGVNDIEPGLKQIKRMSDSGNLSFWTDPNAVLNGLKSGDLDMALYWDGRAYSFIDDGNSDFKYYSPEPGVVVAMTWIQKIKNGSPLGYEFANIALSKEAQSCFGSAIRYGIANKDAAFDPKVANEITPTAILVFPPYKEIGKLQGAWIEQWNKEIGR